MNLIFLFDCPSFIDSVLINQFLATFPPTESMLHGSSNRGHGPSNAFVRGFFFNQAPKELVINYYYSTNEFEQAISILQTLQDENSPRNVFRKEILEIAVSHDQTFVLTDAIGSNAELFNALKPCSDYLKLVIAEFKHEYRNILTIALRLFRGNLQSIFVPSLLELAEVAIDNFPNPSKEEKELKIAIGYQKRYEQNFKASEMRKLNILDSEAHRRSTVFVLFLIEDFDFACQVIKYFKMMLENWVVQWKLWFGLCLIKQ